MPILPSASASASPKASHVPVFKAAPCLDSYDEFPQSSFRKLPLSLESGFDIATDHQQIANALQSQFRIKQQFKEQQQEQKLQHHDTDLETLAFPAVQDLKEPPSRLAHGGHINKSQLIGNDSMSISRSNLVNGSMVSIRSEQQLCQLYNAQQHSDYIISDYMDKIATRISLLETELKFAWRALDLLSNEYGKIWTRLEKLENISLEQQSVLSNLMGLIAAAKQQQTDLEIDLDRELELDLDFNVKAPFGSFVEVDNLSDESQKLEVIMDEHSHAFMDDLFVDDDGFAVALGPDERDATNDELFLNNSNAEMQNNKRVDSWQAQETKLQNEALEKLYSDSNLLIYEQQQIMANNARAQLFQEFLNGQRVLEEVSSGTTLDTIKSSAKAKKNSTNTSNTLGALSTSNEVDEIVEKVQFFHLAANKTGQGGNEVVPIEDTGGTGTATGTGTGEPQPQIVADVDETFYKNLNEAYRQNNLTSEISNMERLLKQSETSTEHITTPAFLNLSMARNSTSSLMMIYEGNEEDNQDLDKDIAKLTKTSVITTTSTNAIEATEHREPRKSLRKKKHRKNEMDMINNLKSILAKASNSNMTLNTDYMNICKPNQESNLFLYAERENRCSITSSSSEESGNANGETVAILDVMTDIMIREINKIRGLESLSAPQILQLRQTIRTEQAFFEKLNQVDKNLTLLLLNPVTMTEELQRLRVMEIDEKFNLVMKKFDKNIDTLKKLVGNSFESYKKNTILSAAPELIKDPKTLNSLKENDYSEHLMRNNSDLDEQLKLLETQETEINRKKNQEELANFHKHDIDVNQSKVVYNNELSLSNESSSSIYNQDDYIRSLKKSLERHNSMLFLLHLQNPDKHKAATTTANLDDFLLGTTSPPPPAPNDNLFDVDQPLSVDPFTVKLELQHRQQQSQQKSDSGLSSMSGWSLNSPVVRSKYNDLSVEMIQMMIEADNNKHMFEQESKVNNHIFSEENLNYIHELSKNIPICSAYENKSIFNANAMNQATNSKMYTVNDSLHWDEHRADISSRKTNCRIPDLLKNENQSRQTSGGGYQETDIDIDIDLGVDQDQSRRKPHLTDRLVFYPSTNGIADYNSSNNLAYLGLERFDNHMHMNRHNESNRKSTEAASTNLPSPKRQMLGKSPKVWNKLSNLLPDNLKLKRSMRYNSRSQSLPGSSIVVEVEGKDSQIQGRGQASSYPLVATTTNLELSKRIQKLPMRIMRSAGSNTPEQVPFSVAIKTQAKHKKRSFSLKMNHLMQKAKTYKRHSFGLRHVSSISEPEMNLEDFNSPNDNDSPSSDNHSENNDIERDDDMELEGQLNVDFYDSRDNYAGDDVGKNLFAVVGDIKKNNADMPEIFVDSNEIVGLDDVPPQPAANSTAIFINVVEDENAVYTFNTTECSTLNIKSEEKTPTRRIPKLNNWVQQQHSLDIPSNRDDDDNRSQYSGRTLSSSRRQSTEDSIDTDDEYFCYELRQLEELEKQTVAEAQLEMDVGQALNGGDDDAVLFTQIGQLTKNESAYYVNKSNENESLFSQIGQFSICDSLLYDPLDLQPDESVKKKMLAVLSELKCVVRVEPDINTLDQSVDSDNDKDMGVKKPNIAEKCAQVLDIHSAWQDNNFELQLPIILNEPETNSQDWQQDKRVLQTSSTDTKIRNVQIRQGPPSSSSQSLSYTSEDEDDAIQKPTAQAEFENVDVDSLHDDLSSGATSGPDSPAELSDELEEDEDSINATPTEAGEMKNTESISDFAEATKFEGESPKAQVHVNNTKERVNNNNVLDQSDQLNVDDSQLVNTANSSPNTAIAGSSKWKLLKTLKERKIEERNNQDKIKEELAKENKKVM